MVERVNADRLFEALIALGVNLEDPVAVTD
jgi:hypothetical protein